MDSGNRIVFEDRQQEKGACASRGLSEHMLVMQAVPILSEQRWEGRQNVGTLAPGDISLVAMDTAFDWHWAAGARSLHFYIPHEALASPALSLFGLEALKVELKSSFQLRDRFLESLARSICWEPKRHNATESLLVETPLERFAKHLVVYHTNVSGKPLPPPPGRLSLARLNGVLEWIEAHLQEPLSLTTLAATAGVDRFWFAKMFHRSTGETPHQYVIRRRVEKARMLMLTTDAPLAEIAFLAGFADQAHLTRHFKRAVGTTPGSYIADRKHFLISLPFDC